MNKPKNKANHHENLSQVIMRILRKMQNEKVHETCERFCLMCTIYPEAKVKATKESLIMYEDVLCCVVKWMMARGPLS